MTPHQMLDALSRQTGAALAFNGDGLCRLRFDGRFIVDLEVTDLLRIRVGPIHLNNLPEGSWRMITSEEREALISGSAG